MNAFQQAAAGVCFAAVIIGAVYIICPEGAQGRGMKYIAGLIMLICTVNPFLRININTDIETPQNTVTYNASEMLAAQAEYIIGEALRDGGVSYRLVSVNTDILPSGDIFISSVCITGASDKQKAAELLGNVMQAKEVIFKDE